MGFGPGLGQGGKQSSGASIRRPQFQEEDGYSCLGVSGFDALA